jgi:hypothetical protein
LAARCAQRRDDPYRANQSFSVARQWLAELLARRVRRCVPGSAGRCILRGRRLQARARLAWDRRFHLRGAHALAAVRAARHDGLANVTSRAE